MAAWAGFASGLVVAACGPADPSPATSAMNADAGWVRPPSIKAVTIKGDSLVVVGDGQPNGRVVLRTASGSAYGSAADAEGAFEIMAPLGSETMLLTPESQIGQDSAVSADRLLVIEGGRGPIALLREGAATRRLDGTAALGAIDSDGRVVLASGFAARPVQVAAGGETFLVTPAKDGSWAAIVPIDAAGGAIQVGDASWVWPGAASESSGGPMVRHVGNGWRVVWAPRSGARQSAWLPDR